MLYTYRINFWRPLAFIMGAFAGAVSSFGAYEYALKLEGGQITYLVIGAPVVAVMAGIIPPMAEHAWRQGELTKSVLLWALLAPVMWLVFLAAAERVETGKASQTAESRAKTAQVVRIRADWDNAKAALPNAEEGEIEAKANKNCDAQRECRMKLIRVEELRKKITDLEPLLFELESKVTAESRYKAPAWLLPIALDLICLMTVWFALSGSWVTYRPRNPLVPATGKPEAVTKRKRLWEIGKSAGQDEQTT